MAGGTLKFIATKLNSESVNLPGIREKFSESVASNNHHKRTPMTI